MGVLSAREKVVHPLRQYQWRRGPACEFLFEAFDLVELRYLALRSVEMASVSLQGARKLWNTEACRLPGHSNEVSRIVWLDEF